MADDRPDPDLYERDFYAWTQVQAEALRSGSPGSNIIDWAKIAEEIEGVGAAERNAVRSHLRQIIVHLLKLCTSRTREPRAHWRVEISEHRAEATQRLTPTIRRLVSDELDSLHARAIRQAQIAMDSYEIGLRVDPERRWTLPELLGEADDPLDTPEMELLGEAS